MIAVISDSGIAVRLMMVVRKFHRNRNNIILLTKGLLTNYQII